MESTLKALFDFQKFDGNPDLKRIISSVHAQQRKRMLTLDEAELVSAAGSPEAAIQNQDPTKEKHESI